MKFTFTDMALLPNGTMQDGNLAQAMLTAAFLNLVYIFVIFVDAISFICSKRSINCIKSLLFSVRKKSIVETTKIPQHLAVILGVEDLINVTLLADFIVYASQSGVRKLTFYDSNGHILDLLDELEFHFDEEARRRLTAKQKVSFVRGNQSSTTLIPANELQVFVLSKQHGKELLVDICKRLSRTSQTIDSTLIQSQLAESNVYEADFLIALGCQNKLENFPPWSLRLTEILYLSQIENNERLKRHEFDTMLRAFSSRDRRMGY